MTGAYRSVGGLPSAEAFNRHAEMLGLSLRAEPGEPEEIAAALRAPVALSDGFVVGNRFCIQPMEGWDGTRDGAPTALTIRRWQRFGESGAKLIWGGEAAAVSQGGRANPHQLLVCESNAAGLASLRRQLVDAHEAAHGDASDLLVGLQLTHSGRFARPDGGPRPAMVYRHPVLDRRLSRDDPAELLSDERIDEIAERFVEAAVIAHAAGFAFVDVKHCHGYLGHELLSATTRNGAYGGDFDGRTRFLRTVVAGIRVRAPGLRIGVRVSVFDVPPFASAPDGVGAPEPHDLPYLHAFGGDPEAPERFASAEVERFLSLLESLGIELVNVTLGSPYYNPHLQRPALFPPSDGYRPPEDPLCGVARHVDLTARLKRAFPRLRIVGSGYSYLQQWIGPVGAGLVRTGQVDFVGLGRMALSYPELPCDILLARPLQKRFFCRTFSDCTTAPRNGLVSGCFPLDPHYREHPDGVTLKRIKAGQRGS